MVRETKLSRRVSVKWYPGYNVAAVSTVALAFTAPGQTLLVSLLNVPLRETFNVDPLWLNTSYTIATVIASLPLVFVGRLIDRFGPRAMLVAVALGFGGACGFMALTSHVIMMVVGFFLLRFLGQGSLTLVSGHALAMWFHRRLGTLSGMRSVLVFVAWTPLPGLTLWLFDQLGWRVTWALYGAVIAVVLPSLAWLLVQNRPEDLGYNLDGHAHTSEPDSEPGHSLHSAVRTKAYWLLAFVNALSPMIGTAVLFDLQPMLAAHGMDAAIAATAASAWSGAMAILALPGGWLVDRLRPQRVIAAGVLAIATACMILLKVSTPVMAMLAFGAIAVGNTLIGATVSATTARYFGRKHHGSIRSSLGRIGVIATGLGPLCFGLSERLTGAFDVALFGFAGLCVPAFLLSLQLRSPMKLIEPAAQ